MTKLRKFLISILLVFASITPLWSTGYPVIDISAIMNAIAEFSTTVQHYSQTIQKYKSEYDRLVKAAKTMAKGDFNSIMDGLAQSMTAISGYSADFEWAAEVSAAIRTGQKLTKDAQQMTNSVESAWAGFLQKIENTDDLEGSIDLVWDFFAMSPLAETMAATDKLTGDFLNDAYIKKLKGNEWREKVLEDHADEISEMSESLADAIKAKAEAQSNEEQMKKNLETAKNKMNESYSAWLDAQKNVGELTEKLQNSIIGDGDTESATTKQLRAALTNATSKVQSAEANYQQAVKTYNQMLEDYNAAQATTRATTSDFTKKKAALEDYIADLSGQAEHMEDADKSIKKMEEAYYKVQEQRLENYIEAHTYMEIPSRIPADADTPDKIRYYLRYGTLNGYIGN